MSTEQIINELYEINRKDLIWKRRELWISVYKNTDSIEKANEVLAKFDQSQEPLPVCEKYVFEHEYLIKLLFEFKHDNPTNIKIIDKIIDSIDSKCMKSQKVTCTANVII